MTDPLRGFFITGTDTEIGKTLITALLTVGLHRHGIECCPVKPLATGGVSVDGRLVSEDSITYGRIADCPEPLSVLNPFCLHRSASPHFAAESERKIIQPQEIVSSLMSLAQRYTVLLVEGIGGWLVPIRYDYLVADFAKDLGLPVILVSANRLGTINHTLLTLASIRAYGIEPLGVIFTRILRGESTDLEHNNISTVERIGKIDILGDVPFLDETLRNGTDKDLLWETIKNAIRWDRLIQRLPTR